MPALPSPRTPAPLVVFPLAFLLALAFGCAAGPVFDRIEYGEMGPRLRYQGFSFARPPNAAWYLRRSEQDYTDVTLRRDLRHMSLTHDLYANVSLASLERRPASHTEFAQLARAEKQQAPYEVRTLSYSQHRTVWQGQWCIRFTGTYAVLGAPPARDQELTMINAGYRCLHPAFPATSLDFFYSERGRPDELDPSLREEGEQFLEGVRIELRGGEAAR